MKTKYPPLEGVCRDCEYKCFRVEDINFRGVRECKYTQNEEKKTWKQEVMKFWK